MLPGDRQGRVFRTGVSLERGGKGSESGPATAKLTKGGALTDLRLSEEGTSCLRGKKRANRSILSPRSFFDEDAPHFFCGQAADRPPERAPYNSFSPSSCSEWLVDTRV
jgi:hypothetical protein